MLCVMHHRITLQNQDLIFCPLSTIKDKNHDDAKNDTTSLITQPQEGYGKSQGYQWIALNVRYMMTPHALSP